MTTENDAQHKRNLETIRKLRSGREDVIIETIKGLRETGNREVLPEIVDLASAGVSEAITNTCINLLNDLKDKSSARIISSAIRENRHRGNLSRIVAACWQNGLDYSADIDLFIDLVIEEDYEVALEAFTVVQENIHLLGTAEREQKALVIENRRNEAGEEKRPLVNELIAIVKAFSGPFHPDLN